MNPTPKHDLGFFSLIDSNQELIRLLLALQTTPLTSLIAKTYYFGPNQLLGENLRDLISPNKPSHQGGNIYTTFQEVRKDLWLASWPSFPLRRGPQQDFG